jgi:hypothetical protein
VSVEAQLKADAEKNKEAINEKAKAQKRALFSRVEYYKQLAFISYNQINVREQAMVTTWNDRPLAIDQAEKLQHDMEAMGLAAWNVNNHILIIVDPSKVPPEIINKDITAIQQAEYFRRIGKTVNEEVEVAGCNH